MNKSRFLNKRAEELKKVNEMSEALHGAKASLLYPATAQDSG